MVALNPTAYLKVFIKYWKDRLPDMTDVPKYNPDQLSFWIRHRKHVKKKAKKVKKPHRLLRGVCAKWFNLALDFAIEQNRWPVKIQLQNSSDDPSDGPMIEEIDLTVSFILVVWVHYSSNMYTRPALASNACQKILSYFLTKTTQIVQSWRHRMYNYSSGTILMDVKQDLVDWINSDDRVQKEKSLRRLTNHKNELYPLVSKCNEVVFVVGGIGGSCCWWRW